MKKMIVILVLLGAASVAICAQETPAEEKKAKPSPAQAQQIPAPAPLAASADYKIGPQDVLSVLVWREAEVSAPSIAVRPDGKITLQLLNDVQAAGRTAMDLQKDITEKLKKFIDDPQVTVVVTGVNSQRVFLIGEVGRPGPMPLMPNMTALQAISSAGGPSQFAKLTKIYILRRDDAGEKRIPFNYKQAVKTTNADVELKNGDTIVLP